MILNSYLPGLLAGLLFFLLTPHEPWGGGFPVVHGVEDWLGWFRSWMDRVGILLAFILAGCMCGIRLRDREISGAILLWMAAGSALHHAPPMGMAMLGITLLWWVLLGGEGEVYGGFKGALGIHLITLGAPSATLGAVPMGLHVAYDRLGHRKQTITFVLGLLILWWFLWKLEPSTGNRIVYVWSEMGRLDQKFGRSWMNLMIALASDPVLLMVVPGSLYLGRLGLSRGLRANLMLCFVAALVGSIVIDVFSLVPFVPVLALAVGSFLDREIHGRLLWLGVILGSVLAALHRDAFQSATLETVEPWWLSLGAPDWLGYLPQVFVVGALLFLIVRSLRRISGLPARLARGGACAGFAALTVLAVRWSAGAG